MSYTITGISMNIYPTKMTYYVGDAFDPTGIRIQVLTNPSNQTFFVDDLDQMTFSGFDSSVPCEKLTITVTYEGWTTTFDVEIKEEPKPAPTVVDIEIYGFEPEYTLEHWNTYGPSIDNAYLILVYSDGTRSDKVWISKKYMSGKQKMTAAGTTYMTVEYLGIKKDVEFTITENPRLTLLQIKRIPHILTFPTTTGDVSNSSVTINGNVVTSPVEINNGDVIVIKTAVRGSGPDTSDNFSVNGKAYSGGNIEITSKDVVCDYINSTRDTAYTLTITYKVPDYSFAELI